MTSSPCSRLASLVRLCTATTETMTSATVPGSWCKRGVKQGHHLSPDHRHADNGNAMRASTLESRLEDLCLLRSFSTRPWVSIDKLYSEALFREEACHWVASFVNWYNHRHRHSSIKFVTPKQGHNGQAVEICRLRVSFTNRLAIAIQAMVTIDQLLASAVSGWDQPTINRNSTHSVYIDEVFLNCSRSVIFPASH